MLKRLFIYFAVVFIFVIAATSFNRFVLEKKKTVEQVMAQPSEAFQSMMGLTDEAVESREPAQEGALETTPPTPFQNWFKGEAKSVGHHDVDQAQKEIEMNKMAKLMKTADVEYLARTTLNSKTPQTQRILSTYLLTLGGASAQEALVRIASQPMGREPGAAHTTDETLYNQERALRIMSIDSIAEQKTAQSLRIGELQKIINQTQDEMIKNYAQRKQAEIRDSL